MLVEISRRDRGAERVAASWFYFSRDFSFVLPTFGGDIDDIFFETTASRFSAFHGFLSWRAAAPLFFACRLG